MTTASNNNGITPVARAASASCLSPAAPPPPTRPSTSYLSTVTMYTQSSINYIVWKILHAAAYSAIAQEIKEGVQDVKEDFPKDIEGPIQRLVDDALAFNRDEFERSRRETDGESASRRAMVLQHLKTSLKEFKIAVVKPSRVMSPLLIDPIEWIRDKIRKPLVEKLKEIFDMIFQETEGRLTRALMRGIEAWATLGASKDVDMLPKDSARRLDNAGLIISRRASQEGISVNSWYDAGVDAACKPNDPLDDATNEFWLPRPDATPSNPPRILKLRTNAWIDFPAWVQNWSKDYINVILSYIMLEIRGEIRKEIREMHARILSTISSDSLREIMRYIVGTEEVGIGEQSERQSMVGQMYDAIAAAIQEITTRPVRKRLRESERKMLKNIYGALVGAMYGYFGIEIPRDVELPPKMEAKLQAQIAERQRLAEQRMGQPPVQMPAPAPQLILPQASVARDAIVAPPQETSMHSTPSRKLIPTTHFEPAPVTEPRPRSAPIQDTPRSGTFVPTGPVGLLSASSPAVLPYVQPSSRPFTNPQESSMRRSTTQRTSVHSARSIHIRLTSTAPDTSSRASDMRHSPAPRNEHGHK